MSWLLVLVWASTGFAQQRLETTQETNEHIRRLVQTLPAKTGDYLVGSGDLLRIDVFDVPELSREVRVGESGYISLPLLPVKVRAGGLTAFQLEEKLAELLQVNGLVSRPQVTVFVKEQRSQPITVIGAVRRPMVYQAIRQTTLLEVLSEAGGIAEDAGSVVLVMRKAGPSVLSLGKALDERESVSAAEAPVHTITIPIKDLLESGDPKANITLFGGDVVSVPRGGIVYVVGAVGRPGGFVLQNDSDQMSVLKVLALAQGPTGTAKRNQAVIIRKNPKTGKDEEIGVNLAKIMERKVEDVRLLANDILFVPDSTGKKALRRTGDIALGITTGLVILRGGR